MPSRPLLDKPLLAAEHVGSLGVIPENVAYIIFQNGTVVIIPPAAARVVFDGWTSWHVAGIPKEKCQSVFS
jgi:hypothetical protein